jgi:hypothetical protein
MFWYRKLITTTMYGMNNCLHAEQTGRGQRSNRFSKEREPQLSETNLL